MSHTDDGGLRRRVRAKDAICYATHVLWLELVNLLYHLCHGNFPIVHKNLLEVLRDAAD